MSGQKNHKGFKSKIWLIPLLMSWAFNGNAQNEKDSLLVVNQTWKTEQIKKGVLWKQGHFKDLFGSEQEINFVEVDLKKAKKKIAIAGDPKILKKTSQFARENKAMVAINGGFFDMKNGGSVDYIKVNGQVINLTQKPNNRVNAVLSIHQKNIRIEKAGADNTELSTADYVLLSGPHLVQNGQIIPLENNPFNSNRHPRTAIALTQNHHLMMIVIDGRNALAHGMSLDELSKVLLWLGAEDAMNLDGGGSSTLYIKGKGVVNYPSDNKLFDHEGERPVANIVYLKK